MFGIQLHSSSFYFLLQASLSPKWDLSVFVLVEASGGKSKIKMRKCPPGTCSANASNVKFGNMSAFERLQMYHILGVKFPRKFKFIQDIHDI